MTRSIPAFVACSLVVLSGCAPGVKSKNTEFVTSTPDGMAGARTSRVAFNRPPELIPGKIPERVRYKYADDIEFVRGAARLNQALRKGSKLTLFADKVGIFPGAWKVIGKSHKIGIKNPSHLNVLVPNRGWLQGVGIHDEGELASLAEELRRLFATDGGYTVRALSTAEMRLWWAYIPFDIEEPVYIAESARQHYRFLFCLSKGQIIFIDELNNLPNSG